MLYARLTYVDKGGQQHPLFACIYKFELYMAMRGGQIRSKQPYIIRTIFFWQAVLLFYVFLPIDSFQRSRLDYEDDEWKSRKTAEENVEKRK